MRRAWQLGVAWLVTLAVVGLGLFPAPALAQSSSGGPWTPLPAAGAPSPRFSPLAAWTGHQLLIWGGSNHEGRFTTLLADGARYTPATQTWSPIATAGAPPATWAVGASDVWTGTEWLIFGGGVPGGGVAYNPATDTWRPLPTSGAPSPRSQAIAVWTGQEAVVWGGSTVGLANDGARYDPMTNRWQPMSSAGAPSARFNAVAVWTGQEMVVWGGHGANNQYLADGAAYNPTTNSWRPLPTAGAPSPRELATAVWTGQEMVVWGGTNGRAYLGDGGAYNPTTNIWRPVPTAGAPQARAFQSAIWTGSAMLIWGGTATDGEALGDGAAYLPERNAWAPITGEGAPSQRCCAAAVWTGEQMLLWGGQGSQQTALGDGTAYTPPLPVVPHDSRYFSQTGYRIDDDTIWEYFNRRGGVPTFGYPTSRTFTLQGFTVQFFQRRIVQLGPNGQARLLNLLDPGLLPYTRFNGSAFPGVDSGLVATAPSPTNQPATLAWVQAHAPNSVGGSPTNYYATFRNTVTAAVAFPNGGDASLLPGFDLEMWGIPTSQPVVDPNNHGFIYLRWQRGIMHFDASCNCTQGILLADYFKAILTGRNLPADLAQESASSPFRDQYDPNAPNWVRNPSLLPNTDLTNAFTQE